MRKLIPLVAVLFIASAQANSIEGCYLSNDKITSAVSEESEIRASYIAISRVSDDFFVQGVLWGPNFHVCGVAPIEDQLQMIYIDGKLVYTENDSEYDISCKLELSFKDEKLNIKDSNGHCAKYIFICGDRVGLNGAELPKVVQKCPETDT